MLTQVAYGLAQKRAKQTQKAIGVWTLPVMWLKQTAFDLDRTLSAEKGISEVPWMDRSGRVIFPSPSGNSSKKNGCKRVLFHGCFPLDFFTLLPCGWPLSTVAMPSDCVEPDRIHHC